MSPRSPIQGGGRQHTLDQTLSETDKIIRKILDVSTVDWGIEATLVEMQSLVEIGVGKNTTVAFPRPADDHHRRSRLLPAP